MNRINKIIDVHTHMFNGHYVPLGDIFHYKFGLGKKVSVALGVVVNNLVNTKPEGDYWFDDTLQGWKSFADDELVSEARVDSFAEYLSDTLAKKVVEQTSSHNPNKSFGKAFTSELLSAVVTIVEEDAKVEGYEFSRETFIEELSPNFLVKDRLSHDVKRLVGFGTIFSGIVKAALLRLLKKFSGHISFVAKMLLHEQDLAEHLTGDNYRDEDKPALTVHLMMDMEPAYVALGGNTPPKLDFISEQISRALDVTRNSGGKLLGFVAYDPRRGEEGVRVVKDAISAGYAGVKLYPPMGYLPNDFEKFSALYEYCSDNSIPIMTHCTPVGFDAKKSAGFGLYSDPDYWKEVLEKYNDLVICFGHAGGGDYNVHIEDGSADIHFNGWYDFEGEESQWDTHLSYPRKIVELCQKYPNAYTDMSYLHGMISDEDKRRAFVENLKRSVGIKTNGLYDFGDKMMYGSDWHMSHIVNRTNKLLDLFQSIFLNNEELEPYSERFFFSNAVRFLHLEDYVTKQNRSEHRAHSPMGLAHLERIVEEVNQ